jgi:glycosyltransferase involved in cell wall biosynthesis
MPEVSVVIPTRNRWEVLESSALRSALSQQDVELEVVVVDDGSSDGTTARIRELDDERLRIVRHEQAKGVAAARNAGVAAARGEWIAFLDDDDLWSPRKLRSQLDRAAATGASFVYARVIELDDDGNVLQVSPAEATSLEILLKWNTVPAGASNILARADHVRATGGFDERLTYVADWDAWINLARLGDIALVPEVLVAYIRHGSGMGFSGRTAVDEMRYFVEKHRPQGLRVDPAVFLWWIAADNRLNGRRRDAAATYFRTAVAYRKPQRVVRAATALLEPRRRSALKERAVARQGAVSPAEVAPWLQPDLESGRGG